LLPAYLFFLDGFLFNLLLFQQAQACLDALTTCAKTGTGNLLDLAIQVGFLTTFLTKRDHTQSCFVFGFCFV